VIKLPNVLLRCGKCKNEYYCNVECQRLHWKIHKTVCRGDPFDTAEMDRASKKLLKKAGMTNDLRKILDFIKPKGPAPYGKEWHRSIQVVQGGAGLRNFMVDEKGPATKP